MFESKLAESVYENKYSLEGKEDWKQTCWRIASNVAQVEERYGASEEEVLEKATKFMEAILNRALLPGGRIISNTGTGIENLYNCFFFRVEDSRESIYSVLQNAAEIFAWGGGVGIDISNLRERGAKINSTGGESSGAVSFLRLFDLTGDIIQQASRRAAIIATMDVSHPDILEFIHCKSQPNRVSRTVIEEFERNLKHNGFDKEVVMDTLTRTLTDRQLLHFNISVILSDDFMTAVELDEDWNLISPSTKQVVDTVKARDLMKEIVEHVWINGDPGILFKDRIDMDNMVPYISKNLGVNPCGEINLLSGEPCNLASINLHSVVINGEINYSMLEYLIRLGVRFLDNVHDISYNRISEVNKMAESLRRIGLGVMGFADLLAELEIPYDSGEAVNLAKYLSWFITHFAWAESMVLAEERGAFPAYDKDKVDLSVIEKIFKSEYMPDDFQFFEFMENVRKVGVRNVSVTAIAPTGSISLLSEVNSSIEPFYSLVYERNITEGESNLAKKKFVVNNPIFKFKLLGRGISKEELEEIDKYVLENRTVQGCSLVPLDLQEVFKTAHDLSPEAHIDIQAGWQTYISNAISKTINLPNNYREEDLEKLLIDMWKKDIKSSTIYRDGSRFFQILN